MVAVMSDSRDFKDSSLPDSVHGILQAGILEWVAIVTSRTVACQTLSMGFSRQEYWSGFPFPPPGDLPKPGIEPLCPVSPALASGFFTTSTTLEAHPSLPIPTLFFFQDQLPQRSSPGDSSCTSCLHLQLTSSESKTCRYSMAIIAVPYFVFH